MIATILTSLTVFLHTCTLVHMNARSQTQKGAQGCLGVTLLKEVIIIGRKKLSTYGENVTAANEDIAMTSSISIRDQDRDGGDGKGKNETRTRRTKRKGSETEQVE